MKKPPIPRPRTPQRQRLRQRGVALIEVLVAILIFSIGVLGLIGLQSRAIAVSIDAEDRNRASLLANELITELWLSGEDGINADQKGAWEARLADPTGAGLPKGRSEYAINPVAGGRQVDLTIIWEPPNRPAGAAATRRLTTTVVLPGPRA